MSTIDTVMNDDDYGECASVMTSTSRTTAPWADVYGWEVELKRKATLEAKAVKESGMRRPSIGGGLLDPPHKRRRGLLYRVLSANPRN
jgi:hypothetical protein